MTWAKRFNQKDSVQKIISKKFPPKKKLLLLIVLLPGTLPFII
jgi:hypothetical protein